MKYSRKWNFFRGQAQTLWVCDRCVNCASGAQTCKARSAPAGVKTAETHRSNVMRKLELHSISDLVRYAVRNKIIEP